jgi:Gluconate 2-dehydrogenase subunit 3
MGEKIVSRRQFFNKASLGIGSAWLAAHWPDVAAAQEHARHAAQSGEAPRFEFFTAEQAREVEAVASQIIPSDDTPGARETGAVYFIDRALATFDSDKQKPYADGLAELRAKLQELFPGAVSFSAASSDQQIAVLKAIEKSDFFELIRTHTLMGFLCLPERGGNRDGMGWKLIGMEDAHAYAPPFGEYDRDYSGWVAANTKKVKE